MTMAITAEMVRDLREKTGAGMMECKKALTESEGDLERATQLLRERGQAVAAKREGKVASEGIVYAHIRHDGQVGVLAELNCETDFVARTDDFQNLAYQVAEYAEEHPNASIDEITSDAKIQDTINEKVAKLGERIVVKRVEVFEGSDNSVIASYIHTGGKIGVMVEGEAEAGVDAEEAKSLLRDVAMHVSFAQPQYLHREEIPQDAAAREMEVHETWARNEGKPEAAIPKIAQGRMDKQFYQVHVLHEQPYIRDQNLTIRQVIEQHPANVRVKRFVRIRVGEE
jgi:elongation factor Ts